MGGSTALTTQPFFAQRMVRQRPLSLLLAGLGCALFAMLYLLWFVLATWTPLRELLGVALGETEALPDLTRLSLASTATVRAAFVLGAVRTTLIVLLLVTGVGLVFYCRWARRAAVFGGALLIVLALTSTVARLWFLTPPGGAVKVTPLLMDAMAILFANVLCGTMFFPEIRAAYAGMLEPAPPDNIDLSRQQPAGA
jgi:hypothetical protein